jgi:hypothetical protein
MAINIIDSKEEKLTLPDNGADTLQQELQSIERTQALDRSQETKTKMKLPEEGEFVDSFIDSRGIERVPSTEIVRLDAEACEAIDDYFTEHDEFADRIEELAECTMDLQTHVNDIEVSKESPSSSAPTFYSIRTAEGVVDRLSELSKSSTEQAQISAENAIMLEEGLSKLEQSQLVASLVEPSSSDYAELTKYLSKLPSSVSEKLTIPGNLKLRFSESERERIVEDIKKQIQEAKIKYTQQSDDMRKLVMQILAEHADKVLSETAIPVLKPEDQQHQRATNVLGKNDIEAWVSGMSSTLKEISADNSVGQNAYLTQLMTPDVATFCSELDKMHGVEDEIVSILLNPQLQKVINLVGMQANVAANMSEIATRTLEEKYADLNAAYYFLQYNSKLILKASKLRLKESYKHLYNEQALPKLYLSGAEEGRIREIHSKLQQIGATSEEVDSHISMIKTANFNILDAMTPLIHFTSHLNAILGDGHLRTKQNQIDEKGVLHEHTAAGRVVSGDELATHSSVVHFSIGSVQELDGGIYQEDVSTGAIQIPLGLAVEHAPVVDH